jgi:hypothetical protein
VRSLGWKAHIPGIFLSPDMLGHPGQACVHGPLFFIEFVVYFFLILLFNVGFLLRFFLSTLIFFYDFFK